MIARGGPAFVTRQCSFKKRQSHVTAVRFRLTGKIEIAKTFSSPWPAMSLIPSESYSFPDHFTSTVAPLRKPKNVEPEPEPIESPRKKPSIVALPNPEPQPAPAPIVARENPEPARKAAPPVPNPALRRASAPPPRISEPPIRKIALPASLKPKVRWNNRAPAMDPAPNGNNGNGNGAEHVAQKPLMPPAQNVIQMKPAPPRPPRVIPRPENLVPQKPAPVVPAAKPAPASKTAQPIPAPTIRANPRPVVPAKVEVPAVRGNPRTGVTSNPQADFFEMFAQG